MLIIGIKWFDNGSIAFLSLFLQSGNLKRHRNNNQHRHLHPFIIIIISRISFQPTAENKNAE